MHFEKTKGDGHKQTPKVDQTKRPSLPKKPAPTSGRRWCPASQVEKKSSNGFVHTHTTETVNTETHGMEGRGKGKRPPPAARQQTKKRRTKTENERKRESALSIL